MADLNNHRSYVGPEGQYDLIAAMAFNLLTTIGLRETHKLLDVGCGSLRIGRLLIPYLNSGNYYGIEPFAELCRAGVEIECGSIADIKLVNLMYEDKIPVYLNTVEFDFILFQSIFTHCDKKMIEDYLNDALALLSPSGMILATFFHGEENKKQGWQYPGCTFYSEETVLGFANNLEAIAYRLNWRHPNRQSWYAFQNVTQDDPWFIERDLIWNNNAQLSRGLK